MRPYALLLIPLVLLLVLGQANGELSCYRLEKNLSIDSFGAIKVSDTYYVMNSDTGNSSTPIADVRVNLPANSTDISVSDQLGQPFFDYYVISNPTFKDLHIPPRYASHSSINPGEKASFTVSYSLPLKTQLKPQDQYRDFNLEISFPNSTMPVEDVVLAVKLPIGAKLLSSSLPSPEISTDLSGTSLKAKITLGGFKPFSVTFRYSYPIFWSSLYPTIWSCIIVGAAVVTVIAVRKPKTGVPRGQIRPEIRDFTSLYGEKVTLSREMETLQRDWKAGKISRYDFDKRSASVREQLKTIEERISTLKGRLRGLGGRYIDLSNRIDSSEMMMETLKGNLEDIEGKFFRGAISKDVYLSLSSDFLKKIEGERRKIESTLAQLYEF